MDDMTRNGNTQRDDERLNIAFGRIPPREFFRVEEVDTGWHGELPRRRLQRLLSTSIFICFLVLFFDNKNGIPRKQAFRNIAPNKINESNATVIKNKKLSELSSILKEERDPAYTIPLNVSGIFSGKWHQIKRETYQDIIGDSLKSQRIQSHIFNGYPVHGSHRTAIRDIKQGSLWLFLQMKASSEEKVKDDLAYITGQAILHDEDSTFATTIFAVQGSLLRRNGKLVLFGNQPDSSVQLTYPRSKPNVTTNSSLPFPSDSSLNTNKDMKDDQSRADNERNLENILHGDSDSFVISPPKFRIRGNPNVLAEQCYYRLDFLVQSSEKNGTIVPHPPKQLISGTLSSENCDLYMNVTAQFENQDLHKFYSKATQYAVIMTIVSMLQIYLLLRQLQSSNTQAAAAKVSLLCIGQQAILDSYLCLLHLTAGIIARQIFTAFATVAFFKLIIFSIFEMRYLLLIWKARRPQNFADGWLTMRREFTILYSRFYCTLLFGILLVYNFWHQINFLVLIAYSFWVPQIIHNAHREVRNALDIRYLLGITALRLVLPLYIYGLPGNFPSEFPMYRYKRNLPMCYAIFLWMFFQAFFVLLQQHFGPRFFIPARFLPQKYNYYRRLDPSVLSLLQDSGDGESIDCVICMVGVDIESRDFMLAPCDHIFHRECLEQWMEIKMECPTCRHSLPQP